MKGGANMALINGDSLEFLKHAGAEKFDMVLTDPPYLQNYASNRAGKTWKFANEIKHDSPIYFPTIRDSINECYRVLKPNTAAFFFCNTNAIDLFKQAIEEPGFKIKNIIIWNKGNHTAGDLEAALGHCYEFIILANKGRCKFNGKRIEDIVQFNRVPYNHAIHQNQKPQDLLRLLIEKWSEPGDLILDPFAGSGSTLMAAHGLGRYCTAIELDVDTYKRAAEWLEQEGVL